MYCTMFYCNCSSSVHICPRVELKQPNYSLCHNDLHVLYHVKSHSREKLLEEGAFLSSYNRHSFYNMWQLIITHFENGRLRNCMF